MSVWKKLFTAVKGTATEAAQAVVDTQAIKILEQEIREAKDELRKSDHARTQILAKCKLSQQKVDGFNKSIAEYEEHARKAIDTDRQLALDCAQRVSDLRTQLETEQTYLDQFTKSEKQLAGNITQAKNNLRRLEQQVDMIKATESVQRAQVAVSSSHLGANSKMKTATESLSRIQEKQNLRSAELEAAEELAQSESTDDLEKRLAGAGIKGGKASADDELSRILGK
ncbi:PspA/IM30 family protein [Glaciecola sp.]|jgi:phage shock protein A|uniref:PspA/IM30 family protein n=1 Tax=Glaciecola sp. MF2-115 TaxID=3384827 RepID=UPI003988A1A5|mmetsp:Transcript_55535/g.176347  ORF Transcript_55535/g.176347 Transcript_55535/m.176347 type:complete len:227 (+) Transcript_55535:496-1176(+)|eukprot:CAMPEP_0182899570 /NCGR_PEP_ID=MMETSP0034_2-20130328/28145_1 /TAXON_ID=156128 /ORGANISM="Nephroselmis pyriformis, Strain CCMP717" /LENGTH=226 /DNA_ID=CAMNT_0025033607 /DNA_START=449 /DNA_END=1129 /DNA_ORIENTATION=+